MTRRRAAPDPLLAGRAQDRRRAQRRHPRGPGHRHLRPRDQAGHPGPHRGAGRAALPRSAGRARRPPRRPARSAAPAAAARRSRRRPPPAPAPARAAGRPGPAPAPRRARVESRADVARSARRPPSTWSLSKRTSAHVATVFEIDMTRVDHLRHKHTQRLRGAQRGQAHLPAVHPEGHGRRAQGLPGPERQRRRRQRSSTRRTSTSASRWPSTGASSCP